MLVAVPKVNYSMSWVGCDSSCLVVVVKFHHLMVTAPFVGGAECQCGGWRGAQSDGGRDEGGVVCS